MTEITEIGFQAPDPFSLGAFYEGLLGMTQTQTEGRLRFAFEGAATSLAFAGGGDRPDNEKGVYWKIGLTVRDLDHAVRFLRGRGATVSDPRQFGDIGYLCHLSDPAGFSIELLQQGFAGRAADPGKGHPVAGQGTLAHLTFRSRNLAAAERVFCEGASLSPISHQPVPDHGFDLHFYSGGDETPPDLDLAAVSNREWLWRRPYALIEVQHLTGDHTPLRPADAGGFRRVTFSNDVRLDAADLAAFL